MLQRSDGAFLLEIDWSLLAKTDNTMIKAVLF